MNSIITRFAPSPTGNLHLGSIRTALINYIVAMQSKGRGYESKFLLRIEDTDKERSSIEFKNNIIDGLKWLGIVYDEEPVIQSEKIKRHQEIAYSLLSKGKAFKCICSREYLQKKREENKKNKNNDKKLCKTCEFDKDVQSAESDYVIRIKNPNDGKIIIKDLVQGNVEVKNKEIDDFVLLRKDGSPTYMLSAVVDDYDMGVNLIIRGDDHLNNSFRQIFIYLNMGWLKPNYAHLPLIHGADGKKLSKRHGAVDINNFKDSGYLVESIINNLILLGWSAGKLNEVIEMNEIIKLFNINKISKSSSIFNYNKLKFFNNYYIKNDKNFSKFLNYCNDNILFSKFNKLNKEKLLRIFNVYKKNINFYKELENIYYVYDDEGYKTNKNKLLDKHFDLLLNEFLSIIEKINNWEIEDLENIIKNFILQKKIKFSLFGKPTRLMLINIENGPSISDILYILGKKNSIERIKNYITNK